MTSLFVIEYTKCDLMQGLQSLVLIIPVMCSSVSLVTVLKQYIFESWDSYLFWITLLYLSLENHIKILDKKKLWQNHYVLIYKSKEEIRYLFSGDRYNLLAKP